ncbi:hypothetical protein FPZ54_03350 [Sphingomonas suaedae]|uniref:Uncharacterized protein n=1 Tax=Sphingomonas suaedae TaxID=2599297 RepID=A0A518RCK7_9SPHN|nr:FecR domain-containing protein [Sphingomonas suaedae]QDX25154.1 hypothetical protein FPZ54_03350 [Sphingomonas suaedae]
MSREHDAAAWFARMRGPDATGARSQFEAWYGDSENAAAYDHLVRSWEQAKFLANTPTGRARNLELARPGRQRKPIVFGMALAAAVCLCLVWAMPRVQQFLPLEHSPSREIASLGDSLRTVLLADGSRVTLDRASRLAVDFRADERRLRLIAGRARFDVAHDPVRPFMVDAGPGTVIAHGTVFDVSVAPGGVEIVLLQGAIEARERADGAGRVRRLSPGQKVLISGGALEMPVAASMRDMQWVTPMIAFDATPLDAAVARFNRIGGRRIVIEGQISPRMRVTGTFRRDDPAGFATTIAASFGLEVRREEPAMLVLVAQRSEKKS